MPPRQASDAKAEKDKSNSTRRTREALNEEVSDLQEKLVQVSVKGKIIVAKGALMSLRDLFVSNDFARAHAALICSNEGDAPTWDTVLGRTIYFLSELPKLGKADIEKLRVLLGAALSSGPGALSIKAELKVFCYICVELGRPERTPAKVDKTSAHPDCIGVLLQLTSARPQLLARLSEKRRRFLFDCCREWISGERSDGDDDGPGNVAGGPDPSVAAVPQLMVQYAQILNQLVVQWVTVRAAHPQEPALLSTAAAAWLSPHTCRMAPHLRTMLALSLRACAGHAGAAADGSTPGGWPILPAHRLPRLRLRAPASPSGENDQPPVVCAASCLARPRCQCHTRGRPRTRHT